MISEKNWGLENCYGLSLFSSFQTIFKKKDDTPKSSCNKCDFQKLSSAFGKLTIDSNIRFKDTKQYTEQLKIIKDTESQLRFYKNFLLSQQGVKEQLQNKKSTD